jgi:hypothetical protein
VPSKAVRFSNEEDKAIRDFLEKNSYLDFSTLARIAIVTFIQNPELKLKPTTMSIKMKNEKRMH